MNNNLSLQGQVTLLIRDGLAINANLAHDLENDFSYHFEDSFVAWLAEEINSRGLPSGLLLKLADEGSLVVDPELLAIPNITDIVLQALIASPMSSGAQLENVFNNNSRLLEDGTLYRRRAMENPNISVTTVLQIVDLAIKEEDEGFLLDLVESDRLPAIAVERIRAFAHSQGDAMLIDALDDFEEQ